MWEETEKSAVSGSPWDPEQDRLEAASFTRGKLAAHSWDPTHESAWFQVSSAGCLEPSSPGHSHVCLSWSPGNQAPGLQKTHCPLRHRDQAGQDGGMSSGSRACLTPVPAWVSICPQGRRVRAQGEGRQQTGPYTQGSMRESGERWGRAAESTSRRDGILGQGKWL